MEKAESPVVEAPASEAPAPAVEEAGTEAARAPLAREIAIDAVFDIETQEWDKFVVGGLLYADGTYREYAWGKRRRSLGMAGGERALVEAILAVKGTVWAHNGGAFDAKWLCDWIVRLGIPGAELIRSGSRIVRLKVGECTVLDSYALVKISLADFGASDDGAPQKQKTGLPCVCGGDCAGYCSIRRGMSDAHWRALRRYLRADCASLFASLRRLQEWARAEELDLGATVGSSAYRHARRTLALPDADLRWGEHGFVRRAYFGGRVQVFRPESEAGWEYDVVSMYPSRLAFCGVPVGGHRQLVGRQAVAAFARDEPGAYACRVAVPECHVPPLPFRHLDRVAYPWGTFVGTWMLSELRRAIECGVTVEPVQAIVWERREPIFRPWIDRLFALRAGAPGGRKGPLGTFLKFYLNSLTGKFGARPEGSKIRFLTGDEDIKPCQCRDPGRCDGRCGAGLPLDDAGRIVEEKHYRLGPECHVEWSAQLTAEARAEWHRQACSGGPAGELALVYCDTDSLYSERELVRAIGSELGQWECGGPYAGFEARAPKVYKCVQGEKIKLRAKGISVPRTADPVRLAATWSAIQAGEAMPSHGIVGLMRGAAGGRMFRRDDSARHVQRGFGDRILEPGARWTRAPHVSEVVA